MLLTALTAYFITRRKCRQRAVLADDDVAYDDVPLMELQTMASGSDDDESDDEHESDDEEEATVEELATVEEFEYKGKKYLLDPATNDIFDYAVLMEDDDAEEIGIYNPDTDDIEFYDEYGLEPQGPLSCV